jgi:hypothetical protein
MMHVDERLSSSADEGVRGAGRHTISGVASMLLPLAYLQGGWRALAAWVLGLRMDLKERSDG